jgi:hypothetical protein
MRVRLSSVDSTLAGPRRFSASSRLSAQNVCSAPSVGSSAIDLHTGAEQHLFGLSPPGEPRIDLVLVKSEAVAGRGADDQISAELAAHGGD